MKKTTSGFTIVELLIVIVVIAILATISIVAYNGVQTRARNSTNIDTVKKYYRALQLYATDNGEYPFATTSVYYCLGTPYPENTCASRTGDIVYTVGRANNNSTFNDLIRPYMGGQLPVTMKEYISTESGIDIIGAYYTTVPTFSIRYVIESTTCPPLQGAQSGRVGGDSKGSLCQVNLPPV